MPQKKNTVRKSAASDGGKAARRPAKKSSTAKPHKQAARKSPQPRVWRRVAKLAADALEALEANDLVRVRGYLEAIRAVGLSAEQS